MAGSRNFLGESPDERRRRRREALIDAALTVAQSGGLPGLGVRSVTNEAKLCSRYFYESFDGIDDLMVAALHQVATELLEHGMVGLHARQLVDPKTATAEEILDRFRQGLDAAVGVLVDDPRKAAFMVAVTASGPRVRQELQQLVFVVAAAITNDVSSAEIGFTRASALFTAGGLVQLTIAYISGDLEIDRSELVEQLARLTYGAVTTATPDRVA